jgi:hypothetical protein
LFSVAFEASPEIALGQILSERLTMVLQVKTPQEVTPKIRFQD